MRSCLTQIIRSLALTALFVWCASAQIAGGLGETTRTDLGGNNFILGTVFLPSGRPVDFRMRVKLVSPTRGDIISTTDDRGQFIFSGVGAGQYTVVIDREKDFEAASRSVEVIRARSVTPESYNLSIRLSARPSNLPKPGVIYSDDANASKHAVDLFKQGMASAKANDRKGAIEKLQAAVTESPRFISALNELGLQQMLEGDLASSEQSLRAALAVNPNAIEPLTNLGILLFRTKRYEPAEQTFSRLLHLNGRSPVAFYFLGRIHTALAKPDDAIKALTKAVQLGGEQFNEAHRLLAALYLEKKDRNRTIHEIEAYLKAAPKAPDAEQLRDLVKQLRG
jgi:tetratricopeptide (TPR) repeat protein